MQEVQRSNKIKLQGFYKEYLDVRFRYIFIL